MGLGDWGALSAFCRQAHFFKGQRFIGASPAAISDFFDQDHAERANLFAEVLDEHLSGAMDDFFFASVIQDPFREFVVGEWHRFTPLALIKLGTEPPERILLVRVHGINPWKLPCEFNGDEQSAAKIAFLRVRRVTVYRSQI
jgi:hypothetical protein